MVFHGTQSGECRSYDLQLTSEADRRLWMTALHENGAILREEVEPEDDALVAETHLADLEELEMWNAGDVGSDNSDSE